MHVLNKRASTFPLTATTSEPNSHHHHRHHHHHPTQQQQEQQHQIHVLTTTVSATLPAPPRASSSSEHGFSSAATITPRTSCTDEAQACFNLLLILRADTQHLIRLRNDNLDRLERTPPAGPLFHDINGVLAAAARSIAALGPFLERHRWPAAAAAATTNTACGPKTEGGGASQQQQQQQSRYSLRPVFLRRSKGPTTTTTTTAATTTTTKRRRRCKSFSNSHGTTPGAATSPSWEEEAGWLSPEGVFSWTLELTAQHTAALVALDRLERFLAYGVAALVVNDDDEDGGGDAAAAAAAAAAAQEKAIAARRERASWWEQQRGEFENVGLIQSLLAGPRRRRLTGSGGDVPFADATTAAAMDSKQPAHIEGAAPSDLPSLTSEQQQDDGRSMLSELSTSASHWGLTARPRVSPQEDDEEPAMRSGGSGSARRVVTEPVSPQTPPPPPQTLSDEAPQLSSRSETFGQRPGVGANIRLPLSRFNSIKQQQRPRIATQPLPPLVGLPALLLPARVDDQGSAVPGTHSNNNNYLPVPPSGGGGGGGSSSSPLSATTTPLFSPLLHFTPGGGSGQPEQFSPWSPSPSSPPASPDDGGGEQGVETPYTPYTPLDQQLATLFVQKALPSKCKTIQPVFVRGGLEEGGGGGGGGGDVMVVSPVESHEAAVHVAAALESYYYHYGGPQQQQQVSPIATTTTAGSPEPRKDSLVSILSSSAVMMHHGQQQQQAGGAAVLDQSRRHVAFPSRTYKQAGGDHNDDDGEDVEGDIQEQNDDDSDRHWPYLVYMARKQAVAMSRWSLRRSRTHQDGK